LHIPRGRDVDRVTPDKPISVARHRAIRGCPPTTQILPESGLRVTRKVTNILSANPGNEIAGSLRPGRELSVVTTVRSSDYEALPVIRDGRERSAVIPAPSGHLEDTSSKGAVRSSAASETAVSACVSVTASPIAIDSNTTGF
jgi:hypothetical protein